ncbi:CAX-interacting protein 4-like protein [Corchorus olitorius]|uniref:CAX-interacting protein 4-like protein n=1 Tax=Corchorus olitorius TaxID=93759 RepID=A0A1R3J8U5_9ROSI|nr:CAX-interacting protein 4-like protein [Corchorus olitorius]
MPATAGRVRMPANNRVHSSAALQTHGIWQSAIGYDPYAPNKDDSKTTSNQMAATAEPDGENAYASFQGLLALARITGSNADEARGACRKCGRVGHLTFQYDSGKRHRRKSQRNESRSDSDVNGSEDYRVGRGAKRSEERSRKRRHEYDE